MTTPINRTPYNALIDDDGSNTVGTIWNKAQIAGTILDPVDAALRWTEVTTSAVGTQHNFNPGINGDTVIRCTNASLLTITGFPAGYAGQRIRLLTVGAQVDLLHYNAGSPAPNRLVNFVTSAPTSLVPGAAPTRGFAEYQYSGADAQWVLRQHVQGAWLSPAYSAARYTASAGTWTVEAGDETTYASMLMGTTLFLNVYIAASSVSATPGSLSVALPSTFVISKALVFPIIAAPNGANQTAFVSTSAGGTGVSVALLSGGWVTTTNTTYVYFLIAIPVT